MLRVRGPSYGVYRALYAPPPTAHRHIAGLQAYCQARYVIGNSLTIWLTGGFNRAQFSKRASSPSARNEQSRNQTKHPNIARHPPLFFVLCNSATGSVDISSRGSLFRASPSSPLPSISQASRSLFASLRRSSSSTALRFPEWMVLSNDALVFCNRGLAEDFRRWRYRSEARPPPKACAGWSSIIEFQ